MVENVLHCETQRACSLFHLVKQVILKLQSNLTLSDCNFYGKKFSSVPSILQLLGFLNLRPVD